MSDSDPYSAYGPFSSALEESSPLLMSSTLPNYSSVEEEDAAYSEDGGGYSGEEERSLSETQSSISNNDVSDTHLDDGEQVGNSKEDQEEAEQSSEPVKSSSSSSSTTTEEGFDSFQASSRPGGRRYISVDDSDTTTSSDEDEPMSPILHDVNEPQDYSHDYGHENKESDGDSHTSSDDESDSTIYDLHGHEQDRTPRRILRRKAQLRETILCVCLIISRHRGESVIDRELALKEPSEGCIAAGSTEGSRMNNGGIRRKGGNRPIVTKKGKKVTNDKRHSGIDRVEIHECRTTPWTRTVHLLRLLREDGSAEKDPGCIRACMGILHTLLTVISPLTGDREYIRDLSTLEGRTIRSIRDATLSMPPGHIENHIDLSITGIPLFLILRLSQYVLTHTQTPTHSIRRPSSTSIPNHTSSSSRRPISTWRPTYLDLSHLPFVTPRVFLESLDFPVLLGAFGGSVEEVTHLDLSSNGFSDIDLFPHWPNFSSPFPFPNVQVIDLSHNSLSSIPLNFVRLSHLRRVRNRGSNLFPDDNAEEQAKLWAFSPPLDISRHSTGLGPELAPRLQPETQLRAGPGPRSERGLARAEVTSEASVSCSVTSLVDTCLLILSRERYQLHPTARGDWTFDLTRDLPPSLVERLARSWVCDRCLGVVLDHRQQSESVSRAVDDLRSAKSISNTKCRIKYDNRVKAGWKFGIPLSPTATATTSTKEYGRPRTTSEYVVVEGDCCTSCREEVDRQTAVEGRLGVVVV